MSTMTSNAAPELPRKERVLRSLAGALPSEISLRPLLGMLGVALGATISTLNARLVSVGLADIRGAIGLSQDAASWIPTAMNMGTMFIGPFSVYLGGLLGPRKVLLSCAAIFTVASILLPLSPNLPILLFLQVIAGLTSGSFYPLAMSFILRNLPLRYTIFAIALYAAAIDCSTNSATFVHAYFMLHLSWRFDFWTGAVLTPLMMWLVYKGIPPSPPAVGPGFLHKWMGFLYASLGFALLYGALDQGERIDWIRSGNFNALLITALFLLICMVARRVMMPNPFVDIPFLKQRNTLLVGTVLFIFRFVLLSTVLLIPQFLGAVRSLRPEQIGETLLWVALPQLPLAIMTAFVLRKMDSRLPLAVGFALIAIACLMDANLDSGWDRIDLVAPQIVMAFGQAMAFTSMVANIVMEAFNTGALRKAQWVLSFSAFIHTIRIFGGECGASFMGHFLNARERLHSNLLGLHVDAGNWTVQERLQMLAAGVAPNSNGADGAVARAVGLLSLQLRRQAFTLAISDCFIVCAWAAIACLIVVILMQQPPIDYGHLDSVPGKPSAA